MIKNDLFLLCQNNDWHSQNMSSIQVEEANLNVRLVDISAKSQMHIYLSVLLSIVYLESGNKSNRKKV